MNQEINILIIEDHQLIVDGYIKALDFITSKKPSITFNIDTAFCCDSANQKIEKAIDTIPYDIVFLDISIPPSKDKEFLSGEDIGVKFRRHFNRVKIIVSTAYDNNYRLMSILKSVNPEGLLIKNELTFQYLVEATESIIHDIPFYSIRVVKLMRQYISNDFNLDTIDRKLLYHLSEGTMTRDLPEYLPLSITGVEKRKRKLNEIFKTKIHCDKELIKNAKEYGFI